MVITPKTLPNGFEYLEIRNRSATAKIALQGAHLFHYERIGEAPLLWVSGAASFQNGEAIRGGVPLCWPWFGVPRHDAALPQHGFARTALFEWIDSHETDHATSLTFRLKSSQKYRELFPYAFELTYSVIVAEELRLELTTYNGDEAMFSLTQALHSYFAVSDISKIHVSGLEGCRYIDYVNAQRQERQQGTVKIVQEVDRVYEEVTSPVELYDGVRCISVTNEGSRSVVVWNPWREKCARMRAMEPTSYRTMLCIESANAGNDVRHIDPGESHTLTAVIRSTLL